MKAPQLIENKITQFDNPLEDMTFAGATQKSKYFTRESDNYLMYLTNKIGFGNWSKIKQAIRRENRCRLDHLLVSRSEEELKKRVVYLVQTLEKEEEDAKKAKNADKQVIPSYRELEAQFDALILQAERKINEAISNPQNLTITSVIRMANYGLEENPTVEAAKNEQDSKISS